MKRRQGCGYGGRQGLCKGAQEEMKMSQEVKAETPMVGKAKQSFRSWKASASH